MLTRQRKAAAGLPGITETVTEDERKIGGRAQAPRLAGRGSSTAEVQEKFLQEWQF